MRVLFICNQNANRSRTAEELFSDRFETRSAGLYNNRPVTEEELSWADTVVLMEEAQRSVLVERFPELCLQKRLICLNIPDIYLYRDPHLVDALNAKVIEVY